MKETKHIKEIKQRLEYLRGEIRAERISYGEIEELKSLKKYVDSGDVELLQWIFSGEQEQKFYEKSNLKKAFYHFQQFQALLSLEEMKKIRRNLIAIEKSIFLKN